MTSPRNGLDFDQYKTQAKDLLKQAHFGAPEALARIQANHPESKALLSSSRLQLADTQLVIAREKGHGSWTKFKEYLLLQKAVDAVDAADAAQLQAILEEHPAVVRYRTRLGDGGYFAHATLLHHIAGNPIRCPLPPNIVEIAKILLQHGADPNAVCGVPGNTSSTIGLLLTGRQASEAGVAVPLIDLLIAGGAKGQELTDADVLSQPIWNGGRATAEALVRREIKMDHRHAAALGRLDILEKLSLGHNEMEEALVYACVQNEEEVARFLIERGAKGDINVSPGGQSSALHNAAWRGFTGIVKLLLDNGARTNIRDKEWNGTPADWADHGGHKELAGMIRRHDGG